MAAEPQTLVRPGARGTNLRQADTPLFWAQRLRATTFLAAGAWALGIWSLVAASLSDLVYQNGVPVYDAGVFQTIGAAVVHGRVLYRDLWDHKPPGIDYVNALFAKLGIPPWDVHLVQIPVALATAGAFYFLCRSFASPARAALGTALFAFLFTTPNLTQGGDLTETYLALPLVLAYASILRFCRVDHREGGLFPDGRSLGLLAAAGVCDALALTLMPQALADVALQACMLGVVSCRRPSRHARCIRLLAVRLGVLFVPALITTGGVVAMLIRAGAARAMWFQVIVYNAWYARAVSLRGALHLLAQPCLGPPLWGVSLLAAGILVMRAWGRVDGSVRVPLPTAAVSAWWIVGVLEASADRHFWPHDFLLSVAPSVAIITAALGGVPSLGRAERAAALARTLLAVPVCVLVVMSVFLDLHESMAAGARLTLSTGTAPVAWSVAGRTLPPSRYGVLPLGPWTLAFRRGPPAPDEQVAQQIDRLTQPKDRVFIWGLPTSAYLLADRQPATPLLYDMPLVDMYGSVHLTGYDSASLRREVIGDLRASPPRLIVVQANQRGLLRWFTALRTLIARSYHPVGHLRANSDGVRFVFYRR